MLAAASARVDQSGGSEQDVVGHGKLLAAAFIRHHVCLACALDIMHLAAVLLLQPACACAVASTIYRAAVAAEPANQARGANTDCALCI